MLHQLAHHTPGMPPTPATVIDARWIVTENDNLRAAVTHAQAAGHSDLFDDLVIRLSGWQPVQGAAAEQLRWLRQVRDESASAWSHAAAAFVIGRLARYDATWSARQIGLCEQAPRWEVPPPTTARQSVRSTAELVELAFG